ncbi:1-acyl-sn-glycerol-3-phosphate acyltransferase [Trinickia mobilis]|uniref:1-acyl-sn-glycerol-3-phosphate acyltransferase n=1 Tax=Trinickia mobilis TaxID=2816356 RepID=UPI001A8C2203|nr:1-acyl-sn-glycerol-3-phosphate acyltransferase [Trinickia mobilis]
MKDRGSFRALARVIMRRCALRLFRVDVQYTALTVDALAAEACVVTCNHVSLLDGVIVALASPVPLAFAVDTDFARRSRGAVMGLKALAWLGFGVVVPLDSTAPFGMRELMRRLRHGESVMVFPEGRISVNGERGTDAPGLQWLIDRTGSKVVPLEIRGAERSILFAKRGCHWWPRISLIF